MHWFKIHHGFNADTKLGLIAHKLNIPRAHINAIFLDMLEYASKNHDRGSIEGYDCEVASFALGLPENEISNALLSLRNCYLVTGDNIANWDEYQSPIDYTNADRQKRHREKKKQILTSTVTDSNALRNIDKSKIDKKERGTRFALAKLPDSWKEYCLKERPDINPAGVFADFSDYWVSVPGAKGVKLDWEATWRGWVRRQIARMPARPLPPKKANVRQI